MDLLLYTEDQRYHDYCPNLRELWNPCGIFFIYFKTGPVTGVEMKLQRDIFYKPHSEDQGKPESREMKHDAITSTSDYWQSNESLKMCFY